MTERPLLYFALGALGATCIGALALNSEGIVFPDGSVQSSAAKRKVYYLTESEFFGNQAPFACDVSGGFHFANFFEIADSGAMRYAKQEELSVGFYLHEKDDSGDGPPLEEWGYVRTGGDSVAAFELGSSNCDGWVQDGLNEFSTVAGLCISCPASGSVTIGTWNVGVGACSGHRVWCVTD